MGATLESPPHTKRIEDAIERMHGLPALFPVVQKALNLLEDPDIAVRQLENVLSVDPVMVARILKLANSALFGVMREVGTITMALQVIGQVKLGLLLRHVLIHGLFELLSAGRPQAEAIRRMSVASSAAAQAGAEASALVNPQEALVAGLLHNLGELGLLWAFPKEFESVLRLAKLMPNSCAQRAVFGVDASHFGRRLLEAWGLPATLSEAAVFWKNPLQPEFDSHRCHYFCAVHVGVMLADAWLRGRKTEEVEIWPQILSALEVPREEILRIYEELPDRVLRLRAVVDQPI